MEGLNEEYGIGALIQHNGVILQVERAFNGCEECYFRSNISLCGGNYCFSCRRDDETSVFYKEVLPESIFKFRRGDYVRANGKVYIIEKAVIARGIKLYVTTDGERFIESELTAWTPAFGEIVYVKALRSKREYVFLSGYNGDELTKRLFSLSLGSGYVSCSNFGDKIMGIITYNCDIAIIRPANASEKSKLLSTMIKDGFIFNGETLVSVPRIGDKLKKLKVTLIGGTTYCCLASSYKIGVEGDIRVNGYAYKLISGYPYKHLTGDATPREESVLFSSNNIEAITEANDSEASGLIDFLRESKFDFILNEVGRDVTGDVALLHDGDKSKAIISVIRKVRVVNGRKMYQSASGLVYKFADDIKSLDEYKNIVK